MSCCPLAPVVLTEEGNGMRVIGLDIHRVFAEAVALEDGRLTRLGRIEMRRDRLAALHGR